MTRPSARLAFVALAAATGLLAAPVASASAAGDSPPAKMRGHANMADAMRAHPQLGQMNMAQMRQAGGGAMAAKMRGHANMADAMRAHPQLGQMSMAAMSK